MGECESQAPAAECYRHEALIYGSDEELLEVAVPFLRAGVVAGAPTLLLLPRPQEAAVLDAVDRGDRVTVIRHTAPLTPLSALRATHELVSNLAAQGLGPVRMLVEIPQEPWPAWARYEAAINVILGPLPIWGLCPYDTRDTPAAVIADVERTHPLLSTDDLTDAENQQFQDPLTFLEDHARRPDLLQAKRPDAELADPSPRRGADVASLLADGTRLEIEERESLRLATAAVVNNAVVHGTPPVLLRVWAMADRVVVTVTDGGRGTDDLLRGVLRDGPSVEASHSLYHVREAVSDVSLFWGLDGFTVRLVQRLR